MSMIGLKSMLGIRVECRDTVVRWYNHEHHQKEIEGPAKRKLNAFKFQLVALSRARRAREKEIACVRIPTLRTTPRPHAEPANLNAFEFSELVVALTKGFRDRVRMVFNNFVMISIDSRIPRLQKTCFS